MGLFSFLKSNKRFVSEKQLQENIQNQQSMNEETLFEFSEYGIDENATRILEFYFFSNDVLMLEQLKNALQKLNYKELQLEKDPESKKHWALYGETNPMNMELNTINNWTKSLCEIGFEYDCEFDGWGAKME